jgi:PAS domain S-box-containing protein
VKRPRRTIRQKLVTSMMLLSSSVLVLSGVVLVVCDTISFRQGLVRNLTTRAQILAANSTAALAFQNPDDARQILAALKTDPSMVAAALLDRNGVVLASYPEAVTLKNLPPPPAGRWHRFEQGHLVLLQPVMGDRRRLGTLYLKSDLRALDARRRLCALVVLLAVTGSIVVAFFLATWLQQGIAHPVRTLAEATRTIADHKNYAIRAPVVSDDELGLLTEAFNTMLTEIQERDAALRTSEARLRAILESALDCIVTIDHEGHIVEFNPAAEKLFGYQRSAAMGSVMADLLIPTTLRAPHHEGLAHHLSTGEAVVLDRRMELGAVRADGSECPVEIAITRIPQDGQPMFTAFIRDITDRKRAQKEILELNADLERRVLARTSELEATNHELEAFSYSVSHDLRAPLRHIDGFADLLQRHSSAVLDEKGRRYLGVISQSARTMGQLIDDLLVFSRMGRQEMRDSNVDLNRLVADVRHAHATEAAGRDIVWRIADLPQVQGDPAMLQVVFTNLISNAIKYTSTRAAAEIEIGFTETDEETTLFVRDNGVGFEMTYVHKLFGVFQRLHKAEDFEGTGIGLANVRRVIQRHGGRVWAEAEVDHGATFFFTLPRHVPVCSQEQRKAA